MTVKLLAAAAAVALLPAIAAAQCMDAPKLQNTAQCAPGLTWDVPSQTCVPTVGS